VGMPSFKTSFVDSSLDAIKSISQKSKSINKKGVF
jgi:hypothetical protein